MITVKLGDIFTGNKILNELTVNKMKVKTGYKLNKIIDECNKELPKIETAHTNLVIKYAGGTTQVLKENVEVFIEELNDFLQTTVDLNAEKLSISEIEDYDILPNELKIIIPFLID